MSDVVLAAVQIRVGFDPSDNLARLLKVLDGVPAGAIAVAPEGALSGYVERESDLHLLRHDEAARALERLRDYVTQRALTLFVGSYRKEDDRLMNVAIALLADGSTLTYEKINLAAAERGFVHPGGNLLLLGVETGLTSVSVAPQLCRELRYPESWRALAERGAAVFAHLNNAIGEPGEPSPFLAHLVSRAAENQRFLVSANAAHEGQRSPSVVIDPQGNVLASVSGGSEGVALTSVDLGLVSNWYLDQRSSNATLERVRSNQPG